MVGADGRIVGEYNPLSMDDIQPGILLYPLLDRTGDPRYRKALDSLARDMRHFPKNPEGGHWHKDIRPDEMWLDGLYMGGPICAEYAARYDDAAMLSNAVCQIELMEKVTRDPATGLWKHAYDHNKKQPWADPATGRSPEFWGRAMGWVVVAVQQTRAFLPDGDPRRETLARIVRDLLLALCEYQTESGLWYQVVDKPDAPGNWPEISCSSLYAAGLFMAVKDGLLPETALAAARKGYEGVIGSLTRRGEDLEDLIVGGVCVGTGVGEYEYYIHRPVSENDLHGVGAFLLLCAAAARSGAFNTNTASQGEVIP